MALGLLSNLGVEPNIVWVRCNLLLLFFSPFPHFILILRSVSQELSETILTMVANCSNVMNKARQPPPGVMPKGRAPSTSSLDAISPVQVSYCRSHIMAFRYLFVFGFMETNFILYTCVKYTILFKRNGLL